MERCAVEQGRELGVGYWISGGSFQVAEECQRLWNLDQPRCQSEELFRSLQSRDEGHLTYLIASTKRDSEYALALLVTVLPELVAHYMLYLRHVVVLEPCIAAA